MDILLQPETWLAFLTLAALEIVLGIDNIIFLSISTSVLPEAQQPRARIIGLAGAMFTRILLLMSLAAIMRLTQPWLTVMGEELSGRDFILLIGGLFLVGKSALELHHQIEGESADPSAPRSKRPSFVSVIIQIMILDIVFSLDSVITAVGMTRNLPVMIAAIIASVFVMMGFSGLISRFVDQHPTIRTLALSFLILIGGSLVAESLDFHVSKAYLYFAMAFSFAVELVNLRMRHKSAQREAAPAP